MIFFNAFWVGGLLCAIAQIIIDKTKMTPARILVLYVVIGAILGGIGLYQPIVDYAGAGATIPLMGFGNTLANGVLKAVEGKGFIGIFTGGLTATAAGITAAVLFGYIFAVFSRPKDK